MHQIPRLISVGRVSAGDTRLQSLEAEDNELATG